MVSEEYPLGWVDEYAARIRDYVFVREADNLLIKVPNEAYRLNGSGVKILKRLFAGERISKVWKSCGGTPEVRRDLYLFFIGLKQVLQGCVNERCLPESVVPRPFTLDFNSLPVLSEIALTYRCNLQCRFCYAGCTCRKADDAPEMTTEEAKRILRIIREDAQVPSTSFTGGEPTLRRDLPELIRFARHDLGLRVNLITNATLIDGDAARVLKEAGLHSAQVSLESCDEAIHDALTQAPGSFRRTLAGLRHLKTADIRVHTNTTLNRENLESAARMPAFVKGLGLERFSMNMVIPCGAAAAPQVGPALRAGRGSSQELVLASGALGQRALPSRAPMGRAGPLGRPDPSVTHQDSPGAPGGRALPSVNVRYVEIAEFIPRIQRAAEEAGVEFMWYSPTPVCMFNPILHRLGNKGCAACDGLLSVSPAGDVLPCSSWAEPAGNLLREGFASAWGSARACWIRAKRFAPDLCRGCADFVLCQGGCPLYWNHFGFEELIEHGERHVAATA